MTSGGSAIAPRLALRSREILRLLEPLVARIEAADAKVYLLRRYATGPHVQLFKAGQPDRIFEPYPLETEWGLADWVMRNGRWLLAESVEIGAARNANAIVCHGVDAEGQRQSLKARPNIQVKDPEPDDESTMFLMPLTSDAESVGALSFWRSQGHPVFDRAKTPRALQDAAQLISTAAAFVVRDAVSARLVQVLADFHREADAGASLPALFNAHAKAVGTLAGAAAALLLLPDTRGREQWIVGEWVDENCWERPLAFPPTCVAADARAALHDQARVQGLYLRDLRALPATGARVHPGAIAIFDVQSPMSGKLTLDDGPIGDCLGLFVAQAGLKLIEHYVERLRNECVNRLVDAVSDATTASPQSAEAVWPDTVDEALMTLRRATGADRSIAYIHDGEEFVAERQHDASRSRPWPLARATAPSFGGAAALRVRQGQVVGRNPGGRLPASAMPDWCLVVPVCVPDHAGRVVRALELVSTRGPFAPMAESLALAVAAQTYRAEERVKESRLIDTLNELAQKWAGQERTQFLASVGEDLARWVSHDVALGAHVHVTANLDWNARLQVSPVGDVVPGALLAWSQAEVERAGDRWRAPLGMPARLPESVAGAERVAYAPLYLAQAGLRGHLFLSLPSRALASDWQAAREAARELALVLERLRQDQRWRSQVGQLRHALRGPSQGLASAAKLLLRLVRGGTLEPKDLERLDARIHREAEAIDLWAHTERLYMADRLDPRPRRQPLHGLIHACVERYQAQMATRDLEVTVEVDDADRLVAEVDQDMLDIALSNLIDNACKYSFRRRLIEVRAWREPRFVVITVEDYGHGISETDSEIIYEGWQRRAYDPKRAIVGSGLGLPLARAIAMAHGGTLTHTSRPAHRLPSEAETTETTGVAPHVVVFTLRIPTSKEAK